MKREDPSGRAHSRSIPKGTAAPEHFHRHEAGRGPQRLRCADAAVLGSELSLGAIRGCPGQLDFPEICNFVTYLDVLMARGRVRAAGNDHAPRARVGAVAFPLELSLWDRVTCLCPRPDSGRGNSHHMW